MCLGKQDILADQFPLVISHSEAKMTNFKIIHRTICHGPDDADVSRNVEACTHSKCKDMLFRSVESMASACQLRRVGTAEACEFCQSWSSQEVRLNTSTQTGTPQAIHEKMDR
jgi:hypothetical protein